MPLATFMAIATSVYLIEADVWISRGTATLDRARDTISGDVCIARRPSGGQFIAFRVPATIKRKTDAMADIKERFLNAFIGCGSIVFVLMVCLAVLPMGIFLGIFLVPIGTGYLYAAITGDADVI